VTDGAAAPLGDPATWTGHVIVCGLHGVGLRTVEQLWSAGSRVVVVDDDPDPRLVRTVGSLGVPLLSGSARTTETLQQAGLAGAAAVVCVHDRELFTLEVALVVRELRPDVRLVVQMANAAVGRAVAEVTGAGSVLDVAELAAPSVVEACLRQRSHPLELAGASFLVAETVAPADGTLRELFGDLAPVAVQPAAPGAALVVCPGRDHPVHAGDRVTLFGEPDAVTVVGGAPPIVTPVGPQGDGPAPSGGGAREPSGLLRDLKTVARLPLTVVREAGRAFRIVVVLVMLLVATSAVVLRLGWQDTVTHARLSVVDAVYFATETLATVGYGDFNYRGQPGWLRVYAIVAIIVGALLLATTFALLTDLLVSRRLERSLGMRRATDMRDHVVVVGLGSLGVRVCERLIALGQTVVVVERDEHNRYLAAARQLGVQVVFADATQRSALETVAVPSAAAVAVLTSDDLVNIEVGLAVRDVLGERWTGVPVVLRLFDRSLADTVRRSFGFGWVRSTSALAAPWFVGAALGLGVLGTFSVGRATFLVGRLRVAGGLAGLAMRDLSARTRVVAILRAADGRLEHPPRRGTVFAEGDEAFLVGPYGELLEVLRTAAA
jgi:Trk K+ transport system NAD-binding subunit